MHYLSRPAFRSDWLHGLVSFACLGAAGACAAGAVPALPPELWRPSAVALLALVGIVVLVMLYRHYQWRFEIDERTIESSRGIIGRDVRSIRVQDLRNVNVRQSLWQRLLGVGDVEFSSAGGEGIEVTFHGVASPMQLKELVQSLR